MSTIDGYLYTCLGMIECPSPYTIIHGLPITGAEIAIYLLEQDIPEYERNFQGKSGDILIGGGRGEAQAMRIQLPEAIYFYTDPDKYDDDLPVRTYWSSTMTYKMCRGYELLGWNPDETWIEMWLTQHVLKFLLTYYPDQFERFAGKGELEEDGSICRRLTEAEEKIWNYQKYQNRE